MVWIKRLWVELVALTLASSFAASALTWSNGWNRRICVIIGAVIAVWSVTSAIKRGRRIANGTNVVLTMNQRYAPEDPGYPTSRSLSSIVKFGLRSTGRVMCDPKSGIRCSRSRTEQAMPTKAAVT